MRSSIASTILAGALLFGASSCQRMLEDSPSGDLNGAKALHRAESGATTSRSTIEAWREIDRLLDEQKLQEAADRLASLIANLAAAGDDANWAKALVRQSQVSTALGGLETSVEAMKAQPWPKGSTSRAAVELYYAHALLEYLSGYDWEIRQRERVVSDETLDLKKWTAEQIAAEAERNFLDVWERRESFEGIEVADFPYLRSNDYPKGIRSSLRDAVSYLFVDRLLSDSRFWSAGEANDAWQLDLENLLDDEPKLTASPGEGKPASTVHPLLRAAFVFADLERWHRGRHELGAELEARLERQRLLVLHRTSENDQARLRADLQRRLPRFRSDPWWGVGIAELAGEIDAAAVDPEHRIRARELALVGEKAFPGSRGSELCRQLRSQIEAPDFQLQAMAVDGADRRSIEITHRNLAQLYLRAYPVDLDEQLARQEFRGFFPNDDREIQRLISSGEPAASWSVALPATADFRSHRTFATAPLTKPGLYLLVASAEKSFNGPGNRRVALPFNLSQLVLLEESQGFPWEVRLVDGAGGLAAAGVEVALYRNTWRAAPSSVETVRTDAAGRAKFAYPGDRNYANFLLVARRGANIALRAALRWKSATAVGGPRRGVAVHRPGDLPAAAEALLEDPRLQERRWARSAHPSARDSSFRLARRPERREGGRARGQDQPLRYGCRRVHDSGRKAARRLDDPELVRRGGERQGRGVQAADVRSRDRRAVARSSV